MPKVYLTRKIAFCSGHRLHNDALSEEENRRIFGKCNNPNGHGHNYEMEVTLFGDVDPKTGMVMNLTDLDRIIGETVVLKVDHKNLNLDVPEFRGVNPTVENIALVFWKMLAEKIPPGLLKEIRILETKNNAVVYRGE